MPTSRGNPLHQVKGAALTAASCREARALLKLTRPALARVAGVSKYTIKALEEERISAASPAIGAIQEAIEAAGVVLVADGLSAGARLREPCE